MDFTKSQPGAEPIVVEGWFAAAPARVFAAWTDPDSVMKWFGQTPNSLHSASIDLKVGGTWRFTVRQNEDGSESLEGEYQEIEPDEKLVFSWVHVVAHADGAREETPASRVEVTFSPQGKGTFVRLVHSAVRAEDARQNIGGGWNASFQTLTDMLGGAS